ncbi:amylovoran biosynthesis protein AmsE [Vibrio sp. vnigr-6D03]|uniref:glycosyltransferase n=1 Tax=Vibrio sp. vnigr-6D03 TaxID=2058088 RepID=UPI000C32DE56|nr:glycosyltransferase [Vibrio sp. vnigr-6D03]PKF77752.1 amylovoran biosynthesis protein AmsE [Vibrio sp. vnigr-6D03]
MSSNFSVLCSLYRKEKPAYLKECFDSVAEQTLQATEVIVVHDGPLTEELYAVLKSWQSKLPLKQVCITKNVGLGEALNKGLEACSYDLIVRIDTDDINHRDRFLKQVKYMDANPEVSAASSSIYEFEHCYEKPFRQKTVPIEKKIPKYILKRNPLNHMATIFRKRAVLNVGSYQHQLYMEDYYLWLRLQANGYKLSNMPEVLVSARVGNGMLERRRGKEYARSELSLMKKIYELRLTRNPSTALVFATRSFSRLMPSSFMKKVYGIFLRK